MTCLLVESGNCSSFGGFLLLFLKNVKQNCLSFKLYERGKGLGLGLGFGSKISKCNNGTKNTDGPIKASDRCE